MLTLGGNLSLQTPAARITAIPPDVRMDQPPDVAGSLANVGLGPTAYKCSVD